MSELSGDLSSLLFSSYFGDTNTFTVGGVEYHGAISYLKAGLQFADRITTVSPTYSREIRTAEVGMGLDGLLRSRASALFGILNGIDTTVWNPADDPHIVATYTSETIAARAGNKAALQKRLALDSKPDVLVFGVVSRLSWQKGLDLLIASLPGLLEHHAQLALLGSGDRELEDAFASAQSAHPGRIGCVIGYDEELAHLIQAGADALLIPSRFEPCGLTQLYALRYGTPPPQPCLVSWVETKGCAGSSASSRSKRCPRSGTCPASRRSSTRRSERSSWGRRPSGRRRSRGTSPSWCASVKARCGPKSRSRRATRSTSLPPYLA